MEEFSLLIQILDLIGIHPAKKVSLKYEKTHTGSGQFFDLYIMNHTTIDLKIVVNVMVTLNKMLLQNDHGFKGILHPVKEWKKAYADNISYILHDNIPKKNLSDPKDRGKYPLVFNIKGTCEYKLFGIIRKKEKIDCVWESWPSYWEFKQIK